MKRSDKTDLQGLFNARRKQQERQQPNTPQEGKGLHTPGEWEEIGGDSKIRYIHANKSDGTLDKRVATAHGETYDETRANAFLIASAPKLFSENATLKAENEKLRNDVKILREALVELHNVIQGVNVEKTKELYYVISKAQEAIHNAI